MMSKQPIKFQPAGEFMSCCALEQGGVIKNYPEGDVTIGSLFYIVEAFKVGGCNDWEIVGIFTFEKDALAYADMVSNDKAIAAVPPPQQLPIEMIIAMLVERRTSIIRNNGDDVLATVLSDARRTMMELWAKDKPTEEGNA